MSPFFALLMVATLAYGIQIPLLARYARRMDALTVTIYRNATLAFTMLPVLYFVPAAEFKALINYLPYIAASGVLGAGSFVLNMASATYLPFAISQSFRQASSILAAVLFGILFFSEILTMWQIILIVLILAATLMLTLSKPDVTHLREQNVARGICISLLGGIIWAASVMFFTTAARGSSPVAAGYFLELSVGVFALAFAFARWLFSRKTIALLAPREIGAIAAISSTAIIGTLCYAYAVNYGPYALAAALLSLTGVIALAAGHLIFGEKLSKLQIGIILFIIGIVFILQLLQ